MTLNHQQIFLPRGWAWAKVDDICDAVNGKAFKPSDWSRQGTPIIRIQNLRDRTAEYNHFSGECDRRFEVTSGDLLFAWSGTPGTSFGAHIWKGPRAVLNQHIFNIRFDQAAIVPVFLQEALNQNVSDYVRQAQGGVGLGLAPAFATGAILVDFKQSHSSVSVKDERIKHVRRSEKISEKRFAHILEINERTSRRWERGNTAPNSKKQRALVERSIHE